MKVTIIHYHLYPGGVTRIIESQVQGLKALSDNLTIEVLCGNDSRVIENITADIKVYKSLFYLSNDLPMSELKSRISEITGLIRNQLTSDTILHCHNPNLGKNPALTLAIYELAKEGFSVINHCHDFSEDRPLNYAFLKRNLSGILGMNLDEILYPNVPRYHYIVLNTFDYKRILNQHIPASRIHLLPNPVSIQDTLVTDDIGFVRRSICNTLGLDANKKICTYPVRAIERKNLGEFLLFAALFSSHANFVITQPPKNPVEIPQYERWKQLCKSINLGVKFEAGELVNYEQLIKVSDFCITTSTREGFGMIFLEPWLAGTPVIGRNLPYITGDLKKYGIVFPRLYNHIMVNSQTGSVDFKDLDPITQENYISSVQNQRALQQKLFKDNPFLNTFLMDIPHEIVMTNQRIIKDQFTVEKYGERLLAIYNRISG